MVFKVSQLKLAVTTRIRDFVAGGGFYLPCARPLAPTTSPWRRRVDIAESMFDGDGMDPQGTAEAGLFSKTFAFEDFTIVRNPYEYPISNIDVSKTRNVPKELDFFTLFEFSASGIPCLLC